MTEEQEVKETKEKPKKELTDDHVVYVGPKPFKTC